LTFLVRCTTITLTKEKSNERRTKD
jgi:hypothetical protein